MQLRDFDGFSLASLGKRVRIPQLIIASVDGVQHIKYRQLSYLKINAKTKSTNKIKTIIEVAAGFSPVGISWLFMLPDELSFSLSALALSHGWPLASNMSLE